MDEGVYPAVAIANEFLRRARESRRALSATQVHELVYCAHGWHLVVVGQALISGPVAAHRGGVYIPDLRLAGCWGASTVAGLLHDVGDTAAFPRVHDGPAAHFTIDRVWEDYGPLPGCDLTRFTLADKGPWHQVWSAGRVDDSLLIPNRLLREWFGQVATWRRAVEHVSLAVDRMMSEPAPGRLAVEGAVSPRPASNEAAIHEAALNSDRLLLREMRSHRIAQR